MATQFDAIAIGTGQAGAPLAQRLSVAGIGVSIAITYPGVDKFFEQLGM